MKAKKGKKKKPEGLIEDEFSETVRKVLSVPKSELDQREREWRESKSETTRRSIRAKDAR